MNNTYLIQRLQKPRGGSKLAGLGETFAFGGGIQNGGLSKEAMDMLRPIFSFDYMGAAEFEFGAVPKALSAIVHNIKEYCDYEIEIDKHSLYLFCKASDHDEISQRLMDIYKDEYKSSLKEYPRLKGSLEEKEYDKDNIGWLELDNNFLFFKDKEAFNKFLKLLRP